MKVVGYHFTGDKLRDGSAIPRKGRWLKHTGALEMCAAGLHGSLHPFDALQYAHAERLHLCEFRGEILHQNDKLCAAAERKIIATIDSTELCRAFARRCALDVIQLWDAPDVVRRYLESGDESLRSAAESAARSAAWSAQRHDFYLRVQAAFAAIGVTVPSEL